MPYENEEPYKKSKTMVAIMTEHATIVANPDHSSKKWDQRRQRQFEERISNFTDHSRGSSEKCHDRQPHLSPSTETENYLTDSRSLGQPTSRRNTVKDGLPEDEVEICSQIGLTTGLLTPNGFLEELRTSFPRFAKKGTYGHYGQQGAEEWYSHIISLLKQKQRIGLGGECFSTWDSFIDTDLSGEMVSTLRCDKETRDRPPTESVQPFVNLNCQISSSINKLRDGLLAGLTAVTSKLGLPGYLTCLFVPVHLNGEINKCVQQSLKVKFPFELDATEFCTEVLRCPLSPANDEDRNRTGRHLGNLKRSTSNPADVAGGMVAPNGFGAAGSPLASPAEEKKKCEAVEKANEALANLDDREQGLVGGLDTGVAREEGCNLSGLYQLMGVITHEGTGAGYSPYSSYVKKGGGGDLGWCYSGEGSRRYLKRESKPWLIEVQSIPLWLCYIARCRAHWPPCT
ncbi:hypothetical protein HOY82DRAFT_628678 [Tuber indicum]|nr:hypothetical protein HOY82DRAFT_628678 [Tuber indicum]